MQQPALRPLGLGEILDGAFVLYRRNFAAFLAMAALPFSPLLAARLGLAVLDPRGESPYLLEWLIIVAATLLGVLATGALIRATADAYGGHSVDWRASLARSRAGYWRLLRATLSARLRATLGLIALVLPGVYLTIHYFAVEQVSVLEDAGSSMARERSSALAGRAEWRILGMIAVLITISSLPEIAQMSLLTLLGAEFQVNPHLAAASIGVLAILVLPLTSAAYTLLYFDRRVRAEALDVHVAMGRLSVAG